MLAVLSFKAPTALLACARGLLCAASHSLPLGHSDSLSCSKNCTHQSKLGSMLRKGGWHPLSVTAGWKWDCKPGRAITHSRSSTVSSGFSAFVSEGHVAPRPGCTAPEAAVRTLRRATEHARGAYRATWSPLSLEQPSTVTEKEA